MRGGQVGNSVAIPGAFWDEATWQVENHLPDFFLAYFCTTMRRLGEP
jgi:hypothetical protein